MIDYLRNQGYPWNHKRIRRIYLALDLSLRRKPKKRTASKAYTGAWGVRANNQTWSLDFMSDGLTNGSWFRTLNIFDDFNREALWIEVDMSLPAERVIQVLENLIDWTRKAAIHPYG